MTLLFAGVVMLSTACKKIYNMPAPASNNPSTVRLIQYGDDVSNLHFQYDISGNVSEAIVGAFPAAYNAIYPNGVPEQMVTANNITKLSFTNGLMQKADFYNNNGHDLQASTIYNYVNNRLIGQIEYLQEPYGLQQAVKTDYTYLANGDIGMVSVFVWSVITNRYDLSTTFKCEYDDHPNPLYPVKNFYLQFSVIPASPHNLTKITTLDDQNTLFLTTDYKYTYNPNDYPASAQRTLIQDGTAPEVSQVNYTYQ